MWWLVSGCTPTEAQKPGAGDAGAACFFSSSCPAGQYCDLEQCLFECDANTPCADGLKCTPRGRCTATGDDPGDAPAAAAPGVLTTDVQVVRVTSTQDHVELDLHGAGRVRYRLESSAPWVMPPAASAAFDDDVHLSIPLEPARRTAENTTATLHIASTQGSRDVIVVAQPALQGVWQGTARFTQVHLPGGEVPASLDRKRGG